MYVCMVCLSVSVCLSVHTATPTLIHGTNILQITSTVGNSQFYFHEVDKAASYKMLN